MDAEFINVYIAKQKAVIDDFQTKLILQDTKIEMLQQQLTKAQGELEKLKKKEPKGV